MAIFSGSIIFIFANQQSLRALLVCFFTGKVVEENSICWSGRTPSVKPCGFASAPHSVAFGDISPRRGESLSQWGSLWQGVKLSLFAKGPIAEGAVERKRDWGS